MLALGIRTKLREDVARRVRLLSAGTQSMRLDGSFDEPTGVEVSQTRLVMDRHRTRPARAKLHGYVLPHIGIDRSVRIGIENSEALKHFPVLSR